MNAPETMAELVRRLFDERNEARACARVLAHAYTHDSAWFNAPPQEMVAKALAYPVENNPEPPVKTGVRPQPTPP